MLTAAAVAVLLGVFAVPVQAAEPVWEFAGLGDSYSSGTGTGQAQGECGRSPAAYGALYAAASGLTFRQAACSGADTYDVIDFQVRHVSERTRLVTVTIGGNDAGFVPILKACLGVFVTDCRNAVDEWTVWVKAVLPLLLDAVYGEVVRRAPGAVFAVLGYPRVFDAAGSCLAAGMPRESQDVVNAYADTLNGVIAERAEAIGAVFGDVRTVFEGHGVCADDAWVNGVRLSSAAFHPNERGHERGYLVVLREAIGRARAE